MNSSLPKKVKLVKENKIEQSSKSRSISYSQLNVYNTCPKQWEIKYYRKLAPFKSSIHLVFGTSMHEVIQHWLDVMYSSTIKQANQLDLSTMLYDRMIKNYQIQKAKSNNQHFSNEEELQMFFIDGKNILNYLKKNRSLHFSRKQVYLAGIETLLYQEIKPGVYFKGYVDLVFYDKQLDKWTIVDIKTSTSGWKDYAKKDISKISQVLLYKKFFSEQFNIPIDKIEVLYLILKRRIPKDAEYAIMQRRVQEFKPPSGKIKRGQATTLMKSFIENVLDEQGKIVDKSYPTNPSKWNCKFCDLKNSTLCSDSFYK